MRDPGIAPEKVDYITPMGLRTEAGGPPETKAINRGLGDHALQVAVSSTKSMTGICWAAPGHRGRHQRNGAARSVAPPTINYENPDPDCDLDYVPNHARPMKIDYALFE